MPDFAPSFSTQSRESCTKYRVTDTTNYSNNNLNRTKQYYNGRQFTLQNGITNAIIEVINTDMSVDYVDFDIDVVTGVQVIVTMNLFVQGGGSDQVGASRTLVCILN